MRAYAALLKMDDPTKYVTVDTSSATAWLPVSEGPVAARYEVGARKAQAAFLLDALLPLLTKAEISATMKPLYAGSTGKMILKMVACMLVELLRSKKYCLVW